MSAHKLSRERGVTISCNNGALEGQPSCDARFHTAQIFIRSVRVAAASAGWIRGGGEGRRRLDFCPTHAVGERERVKAETAKKAEVRAARAKAKRDAMVPAGKPYHFAAKVSDAGVSALCFKRPRAIDLKRATWTNRREAVTCRKCIAELAKRDAVADLADGASP